MKALLISTLLLTAILVSPCRTDSQTAPAAPRPLVDGTGAFGKALLSKLNTDSQGIQKKNIHPFVIGYCGWRVRALTNFSLTKYDGMQIGLCKSILAFFDPQITANLTAIETSANSMIIPVDVSPADSKAIQDFVVMKYGMYYMGLADPKVRPDAVARWKYEVGGNLGELSAYLTLWWRIWRDPKFETRVGSFLTGLGDDIKAAPKGSDPAFVANLRKLNSLGSKTKFTDAERRQVNDLLTQTLLSAVGLTSISNSSDPIPAAPPAGSSLFSRAGKSASEHLETGKELATKGDYQNAKTEFDQAVKLDPANGLFLFHRAMAHEKLGLIDDAIADYSGVILMRVSLREAYFNRGTLYLNKKDYKTAIADFNSVLALDPQYEAALYNRGLAYYNSNNPYATLGDLNRLLKLQPEHVNALILRSYVYCDRGLRMSAVKDQDLASQLGGKFERGCK